MDDSYDICTIAGDTYKLNMIYRYDSGEPIDLTDYTLYFQVRKSQEDPDIEFDKTFEILAIDGSEGIIKFELTSDETEMLTICYPSSKYVYGMRLTDPSGTDIKTILSGTLEIMKGVI